MAPPASQRPSWLITIWTAAGTKSWTGFSRFAPYIQCISLALATAQLALGCYILGSLLQYRNWEEICRSPSAHDPNHVPQVLRPPFTVYTQDDAAAGVKKAWVGAFSAPDSKGWVVTYAFFVPLCTFFMAGTAVYKHFHRASLSLRLALYIGLWQAFDLVLYLYFSEDVLAVDWYYADAQARFKGASVCFVDGARGKAVWGAKRERMRCLEAWRGIAGVAGVLAIFYAVLTMLAIYRAARESRKAQNAHNADVRLQDLPSHSHAHSHSTSSLSSQSAHSGTENRDENAISLPDDETTRDSRAGDEQRSSSNGGYGHVDDLSEEGVGPFSDPVRSRDMV